MNIDKQELLVSLLAVMDASVDEHGDIWCDLCNKRNECGGEDVHSS